VIGDTALTLADGASTVKILLAAGANVNAANADGLTALSWAALKRDYDHFRIILAHPLIHASVNAAEEIVRTGLPFFAAHQFASWAPDEFARWRRSQAVCAAARAPAVRGAKSLPPALVAALAGCETGDALSDARAADGLTILGGAAAAGASKKVMAALVAAGCSLLVSGDREGASVGSLALRSGQRDTAHWLYQKTTKAVARKYPLFRDVRSMLVVGTSGSRLGRPFLPVDMINLIMDCCATPETCFFSETPAAGADTDAAFVSPASKRQRVVGLPA